jgi:hypothetical protein
MMIESPLSYQAEEQVEFKSMYQSVHGYVLASSFHMITFPIIVHLSNDRICPRDVVRLLDGGRMEIERKKTVAFIWFPCWQIWRKD